MIIDQFVIDRFNEKWEPITETGCWIWTASVHIDGYGWFKFNNKMNMAHRISYEIFNGDIGGYFVCHKCDTPACVNPNHLWLGTNADNVADRNKKGRQAKGRAHGDKIRGENHGRSKLNKEQVTEIKELAKAGLLQREIAEKYNISQSHVSSIVKGRYWNA